MPPFSSNPLKGQKKTKPSSNFERKLSRALIGFLRENPRESFSFSSFKKRLKIDKTREDALKQLLQRLVARKALIFEKKRYRLPRGSGETLTGVLHVHPRGFAFLTPHENQATDQDVFIPKHLTQNAVSGDTVEVKVAAFSQSSKGPEGEVISVIKRAREHVSGIIFEITPEGPVAYAPLLGIGHRIFVHCQSEEILLGTRVILKIESWGNQKKASEASLCHILGHIHDPKTDVPCAIEEFELANAFALSVEKQAKGFGKRIKQKDIQGRLDLSKTKCITIDPTEAKDFDDALSLEIDDQNHYHLGVHIADVSHYIKEESALDKEAKKRCNSTYFPGLCVPMLPYTLSNELCSLKPGVKRLAISVLMHLDQKGRLLDYKIHRSVIKSQRRFTYSEAMSILEGRKKSPHRSTLENLAQLCRLLKKLRYERGGIEFALPESKISVDQEGRPLKIQVIEYDITHQLVEEFMLKANEVVAKHLSQKGQALPYRVHEEPSEENFKDFAQMAQSFGFKLSLSPSACELQNIFNEVKKTSHGRLLAIGFIKSMKLASYSPHNIGHYGLCLEHYCHFTSPIRRYADLIVHRLLFDECSLSSQDLHRIAENCSTQERISSRAENNVILLKKLRLLKKTQKNDPYKTYKAIITQVKPAGLVFELLDFMLEGFIHISCLEDDYFAYQEKTRSLKGLYNKSSYCIGGELHLMLSRVNLITQEHQWNLVLDSPKSSKKIAKKKKRKNKKKSP